MAFSALYTVCANKVPISDVHTLCLYCLGEEHQPTHCAECKKHTKPTLKQRLGRLWARVWEKSLKPMDTHSQLEASIPSTSSKSKSSVTSKAEDKKKKIQSSGSSLSTSKQWEAQSPKVSLPQIQATPAPQTEASLEPQRQDAAQPQALLLLPDFTREDSWGNPFTMQQVLSHPPLRSPMAPTGSHGHDAEGHPDLQSQLSLTLLGVSQAACPPCRAVVYNPELRYASPPRHLCNKEGHGDRGTKRVRLPTPGSSRLWSLMPKHKRSHTPTRHRDKSPAPRRRDRSRSTSRHRDRSSSPHHRERSSSPCCRDRFPTLRRRWCSHSSSRHRDRSLTPRHREHSYTPPRRRAISPSPSRRRDRSRGHSRTPRRTRGHSRTPNRQHCRSRHRSYYIYSSQLPSPSRRHDSMPSPRRHRDRHSKHR
ncbi:hypothetical protein JRQ81_018774 [Phrynocephalus forsythii]|uniref:Uncharacterized protein n=1 Tax=Phrynocephalus forsythii TaxID=171643 RepID=A0A9Q1AZX9_9SAUR|nr:hypothetical protein JRQ81_018774 [Phrynocephalus forsythii]